MTRYLIQQNSPYLFQLVKHFKEEIALKNNIGIDCIDVSIHACRRHDHVITVISQENKTYGYIIERYLPNEVEICIASAADKGFREHKSDISKEYFDAVKKKYLKGYFENDNLFRLHNRYLQDKTVIFDDCDFASTMTYIKYDNQLLACVIRRNNGMNVYMEMGASLQPSRLDIWNIIQRRSILAPFVFRNKASSATC